MKSELQNLKFTQKSATFSFQNTVNLVLSMWTTYKTVTIQCLLKNLLAVGDLM